MARVMGVLPAAALMADRMWAALSSLQSCRIMRSTQTSPCCGRGSVSARPQHGCRCRAELNVSSAEAARARLPQACLLPACKSVAKQAHNHMQYPGAHSMSCSK